MSMIRPDRPRITRPVVFLMAAILTFPLLAAFVAVASPRLATLQHRTLPVLTANHLITLGWGTMIAIGSLHQLLPAAAGVRSEPGPIVTAQFGLHVGGVVLLAVGFWTRATGVLIAGGSAIVLSVLVTASTALWVLRRRTRWIPPLRFVVVAVVALVCVTAWGLVLAMNWRLAFWKALLGPAGLTVHLALGLIGWFATLVAGVSYYLLPRFTTLREIVGLRHGIVLVGLTAGTVAMVAGAFASPLVVRAGLLLAAAAGIVYAADLWKFNRMWPERRDITRVHWQIITVETVFLSAGMAAGALDLLPGDPRRWTVAGTSLFLLGWVTLAIAGQAYKVTPFLMWFYRFHLGLAPLEVPRLEAPYWPPLGGWVLAAMAGGGMAISFGVLLASVPLAVAGGAAFFLAACAFSFLLGYSWLPRLWQIRKAGTGNREQGTRKL